MGIYGCPIAIVVLIRLGNYGQLKLLQHAGCHTALKPTRGKRSVVPRVGGHEAFLNDADLDVVRSEL